MKALQLTAPREFRQIDIDEAPSPGPDEALVQVHRVGICGTDVSAFLGKMPFFGYPRIPGHELGVEVLAVGSNVRHLRPGDACSVEPYINDPESYASRRGRPNCCERLQVLGVHCDGGLRSRFVLPARKLHPAQGLTFDQLALVETLAIGCHAVARSGLTAGDTALIIGAGPIGLSTLEFVRLAGVQPIMLDTNERRLAFCRERLGIEHAITPGDDLEGKLRRLTAGHLPDVVFDATGSPQSMSQAFGLVAQGGRLVYVGLTGEEVRFRHSVFHKCEGTLLCSRNALPEDFPRIIGLIASGKLDTQPWLSHRVGFGEVPGRFSQLMAPETGVIKAIIEME